MKKKLFTISDFPFQLSSSKSRVLVGVRPFRKGGIRIEKQIVGSKLVYHNYGHGGAGVSLAPATAQQVVDLMMSQNQSRPDVTVLGSGINGLLTALECVQRGSKVTVVAKRIPSGTNKKVTDLCTSQIAPGYWLPYHYQFENKTQHNARSLISYKKYNQWMKKSSSLRKVGIFETMNLSQLIEKAPQYLSNNAQQIEAKVGQKRFDMVYFQSIQIHLQNFLQELIEKCLEKGVTFKEFELQSINDLQAMPTKILINCLGLGSKKVFKDENVYGVRGHLIEYENDTKISGIFGFKYQNGPVKLYCFDDKILVGLTTQKQQSCQINQEQVDKLQKRVVNFVLSLGQARPKL